MSAEPNDVAHDEAADEAAVEEVLAIIAELKPLETALAEAKQAISSPPLDSYDRSQPGWLRQARDDIEDRCSKAQRLAMDLADKRVEVYRRLRPYHGALERQFARVLGTNTETVRPFLRDPQANMWLVEACNERVEELTAGEEHVSQ